MRDSLGCFMGVCRLCFGRPGCGLEQAPEFSQGQASRQRIAVVGELVCELLVIVSRRFGARGVCWLPVACSGLACGLRSSGEFMAYW